MAKSSKRKKNNSIFLHTPHTRVQTSRIARSRATNRKVYSTSKRIILVVIVLAMLMVALAVLLKIFSNPERVVKRKIETIAADYYENYFYPQITAVSEMQNSNKLTEKMKRYETSGFTEVSLRQLLLFDNERYADAATILTTYCDENKTYVQFFPESPFEKTNYHVKYSYSCNF